MFRFTTIFLLSAAAIFGQAQIPFNIRFTQGQNLSILNDGGTVTLPADAIGTPVAGTLAITYRNAVGTNVQINTVDLTGSLDFSVSPIAQALPVTVNGGDTVTTTIRYNPTTGNRTTARLVVTFTENRVNSSFILNLVGVAPDFAFSYTPPGGNAQPLVSGGTISFPQTPIDTTTNASISIVNRGSGAGSLASIVSTGAAFQLIGAPLPGTNVDAGRELRVGVAFTPKQTAVSTGGVTVDLFSQRLSFNLEGTGSTSALTYEVLSERGAAIVQPEANIDLPDATVGEKSSITIRVTNSGNADGRIPVISVSGTNITVSDIPPLPVVLTPGNRFTFTITFSPTAAGKATGRLRIGQDQFDLTANGLGSVLSFAYVVSNVSTTLLNNGSLNFVPTSVGANSSLQFQITNTGTAAGSVNSISITTSATVFELTGLPALPLTLRPGATASFGVRFTPTAVGAATGSLRVDTNTFTLNGAATSPAPLPSYSITGVTGNIDPLQQPAVALALASPYPLALSGTLTLAFNSDVFANDPAVQFAPGGRTVNFTIPANTTRAIFPNDAQTIRLQTGTVAGSITLTPSFVTEGGINLTPTRPATLTATVPAAAPRLLNVTISAKTATTITLLISGYSTSRTLTQLDLRFTPVSGETVSTTQISLNVESAFLAWYQGTASAAFGSLFTATLPLTITGDVINVVNPTDTIQSIAVTLANRTGVSNSATVNVQ